MLQQLTRPQGRRHRPGCKAHHARFLAVSVALVASLALLLLARPSAETPSLSLSLSLSLPSTARAPSSQRAGRQASFGPRWAGPPSPRDDVRMESGIPHALGRNSPNDRSMKPRNKAVVPRTTPSESATPPNVFIKDAEFKTFVISNETGGSLSAETRLFNVYGKADQEGLPFWWKYFWKLPFTQPGKQGAPLKLGDTMQIFKANIEEIYGGYPSVDGTPIATGSLDGLTDGTMYLALHSFQQEFGPIYKLCFGPKSFIVVSDPVITKEILKAQPSQYDKGVLAEILEDIMGKGLIPADPVTWKARRRAIVPGFHKRWLEGMIDVFGKSTAVLTQDLDDAATKGAPRDMEERFGSVALDIIGKAVFNYEFESTKKTSPVVKAAIDTLREAEHRSMVPIPYWKLPLADRIIPRQRAFRENMALINEKLDTAIEAALENRQESDLETLENKDYSKMENPSLLRFLVDMRDEPVSSRQLRDDLMTMLVAGHETTASALTWALYELMQNDDLLKKLRKEVDEVIGDRTPTYEDIQKLELTRLTVAESLRMYPEPPLLIRRALEETVLPKGGAEQETKLPRGADIFISSYNLHRSPLYWENPDKFDPERFLRPFVNPEKAPHWRGYDPSLWKGRLYPTEDSADFAYIPFGGGGRKCVGDIFAMLEATVALSMVVRRFDFDFTDPTPRPQDVGTNTGATIHTRNGLWCKVSPREFPPGTGGDHATYENEYPTTVSSGETEASKTLQNLREVSDTEREVVSMQ
mmetsp:Transcript_147/g.368  ORF Transcript_147/g.368 Transcript_147/m.368 type:complete len:756 (-) Transcript_147:467-2734(-)